MSLKERERERDTYNGGDKPDSNAMEDGHITPLCVHRVVCRRAHGQQLHAHAQTQSPKNKLCIEKG